MAVPTTKTTQREVDFRPPPPLWGIKMNDGWWCKDDGTIYYVLYEKVAVLQAELLERRSPPGISFKVERIQ
jgi:hypothetical protein